MPYIGNTAGNRFVASQAATRLSGNGSAVEFTLEHAVGSDEDILVSVDGVIQEPSVAYAVSNGTTLTFTAAPSSNSGNNIFVYYLFRTVATVDHPSTSSLQATDGTFSSTLNVTGETTLATHLNLGDNDKIKLGAGSDIEIYHDGTYSRIMETGGTALVLDTTSTDIRLTASNSEVMGKFVKDGAVELYHNNSKKIETTSSGADVSGTQFNLNGGGSNPSLNVKNNDTYYMTLGHDSINVNQNALKLKVNGSTFFQMDSGGHVTMQSQPAFLVAGTDGSQSDVAIGSIVTVKYDSERFDQNLDFDNSTYTFTASVTGKYYLHAQVYVNSLDSAANYYSLRITTSNTEYVSIYNYTHSDLNYITFQIDVLADMDASDTAIVHFIQSGGSAQADIQDHASYTFFCGHLVC